jgi:NAD(P)H-dependent FMN reductase
MTTIISCTNREGSNTLKLAKYYHKELAAKGFESEIISLQDLPDNFIASDLYGKRSEAFQSIQDKISATSKFIFVVPEYNGSFPGILKLFIDACMFPESFYGKKAALVGLASGKYGNVRGIEHFTGICHYINLHVLPLRIHVPAIGKEFDEKGDLFKEDTVKFVTQQIEQFIAF